MSTKSHIWNCLSEDGDVTHQSVVHYVLVGTEYVLLCWVNGHDAVSENSVDK